MKTQQRIPGTWAKGIVAGVLVVAGLLPTAYGEKTFFRDELNGTEMWRLTSFDSFHVYGNSYRPFAADGRYACSSRARQRAFVIDLLDGKVTLIGSDEERAGYPFFIFGRERPGVIYLTTKDDVGTVHRCWLDTGEDQVVGRLPPFVNTLHNAGEGLIGPKSEYVPLCGDLNGDGLADFGLLPIWEEGPPKILLTSPTAGFYGKTVCPGPERNLVGLTKVNCHPDILQRVKAGERLPWAECVSDARLESFIVRVDFKTCTVTDLYPTQHVRFLTHEAFSGDDKMMVAGGNTAWMIGSEFAGLPIRIGDNDWRKHSGNHLSTCGLDGRYIVADSGYDGMERLVLLDLWTGEPGTAAHVSAPSRPPSKISQDHGHPGGSPDGTKVMVHSCYDLINHRLYAVPTEDVAAGAKEIPVETTEGFAPAGRLLVRHGYQPNDVVVSYQRKDATRFLDCDWGEAPGPRLKAAIGKDAIEKGSHVITDLDGRLFPDGRLRPQKEYIAVVRRPAPPRAQSVLLEGATARLRWLPPERCLETAGYAVYRQVGENPPERLNAQLMTACEFVDNAMPGGAAVRYWVRAVERSGLYGEWAGPVQVRDGAVESAVLDAYDIPGTIYLEPGKRPESDLRKVAFHVPVAGTYTLWARCQAPVAAETFDVALDGKTVDSMPVTKPEWHWAKVGAWPLAAGEHELALSRSVTYEIAAGSFISNPGFETGMDGWEVPEGIASQDSTAPHSGAKCLKIEGTLTGKQLLQKVKINAKPNCYYALSYWVRAVFTKAGSSSRFYNKHPHTSGAFWVDAQPLTDPYDLAIFGDRFDATEWRRIAREVYTPPGTNVAEVRLRPFYSHPSWGEQEGTVWIDDVEFVELGPRLRPVKATELLVTNDAGYVPEGKDGRTAFAVPALPVVPVTGLRQTGAGPTTIAVAWNPTRPGTRGCNIYANAGGDCPVTKYFRKTTAWSRSDATLEELEYGTSYTIKVAALNEDGVEGPAEALTAKTAEFVPETHSATAAQMPATAPLCLKTEADITYLETPKDPKDRLAASDLKAEGLPTGSCWFEFTITKEDDYWIWGRLFAVDGGSNSFFFSLDGAEELQWSVPDWAFKTWTWLMPRESARWHLKPGTHTIVMRTRESGTRLAQLVVTNDLRPDPPKP